MRFCFFEAVVMLIFPINYPQNKTKQNLSNFKDGFPQSIPLFQEAKSIFQLQFVQLPGTEFLHHLENSFKRSFSHNSIYQHVIPV